MIKANFDIVWKELKYPVNEWIKINKITRINLTTNCSLYNELGNVKAEYYYNSDQQLLYKRLVNSKNEVIKYAGIIDINEIVSIETSNPFSESLFNGNNLIRR